MNLAQRLGLRAGNPTSDPRADVALAEANPRPDPNIMAVERAIAGGHFGPESVNSDQVRLCCIAEKIQGYMRMSCEQMREALATNHARKKTPPSGWELPVAGSETSRSTSRTRAKKRRSTEQ